MFSHYFPADIPKGKHNEMKNLMAERMIDRIEDVAPRFRELIMDKVVFTHQYFEKTFGITAGDCTTGLLYAGQMFGDRPVPGWAEYETPLENLFMCGAATHPGPGATCLPGRNGAQALLSKWQAESGKASKPVDLVERLSDSRRSQEPQEQYPPQQSAKA